MQSYLIHYSEIGLKGRNRSLFEERLIKNIYRACRGLGEVTVRRLFGRFRLDFPNAERIEELEARIQRVYGVAYFAPITVFDGGDLEPVREHLAASSRKGGFDSFAVRVRRINKQFPMRSIDIARDLGSVVGENSGGARVDLSNPERTYHVALLNKEIFVHHRRVPGARGLPVGVGARVALMLSGGIDSPVAGELLMKRGCPLTFIHFHSAPFTDRRSQEKAVDLAASLVEHRTDTNLHLVPLGELQRRVVAEAPSSMRIVLYRRYMLRIAERLARRDKCRAVATGDAIGQVASQTLENISVLDATIDLPILRPLLCFDKQEIIEIAQQIGTYDISIEPDSDCCSYLMPRDPATKSRRDIVEKIEAELDFDSLLQQIIDQTETRRLGRPEESPTKKAKKEASTSPPSCALHSSETKPSDVPAAESSESP